MPPESPPPVLPPPAPASSSGKAARPRATLVSIAALIVTAALTVAGWFVTRADGLDGEPPILRSGSASARLDSSVYFGCVVNPPTFFVYSLPQLEGSSHDWSFNSLMNDVVSKILISRGLDSKVVARAFSDPLYRGGIEPGCQIPADGIAYSSIYAQPHITYFDEAYVSLIVRGGVQGYLGHEYGELEGVVFDLAEGRRLGPADILRDSTSWERDMVEEICARELLPETCTTSVKEVIRDAGRIALSPQGLVILFHDCEIAACAREAIEVTFRWDRLLPYLRDDFKVPE